MKFFYTFKTNGKVKTILYKITDVKGRRHGYRIGLDTLIVHAENDECHK